MVQHCVVLVAHSGAALRLVASSDTRYGASSRALINKQGSANFGSLPAALAKGQLLLLNCVRPRKPAKGIAEVP
jgi:hypothetical protein